ncbi:unnamed protein product [Boreogadus saida]
MEEIDSATTSTEPAPSDEADSTHDSVSANWKTYRFNPQWLKTFNWLVYDQSKKSMFCKYCLETFQQGPTFQTFKTFQKGSALYVVFATAGLCFPPRSSA